MINPSVPTFPSLAKFADFVQLKDYRPPTKNEYVRYVRKLGEHYQCDPATLSEDQLRASRTFQQLAKISVGIRTSGFSAGLEARHYGRQDDCRTSSPQKLGLKQEYI